MPSAPKIPWACCTMPLVRGPTATRRARRSESDRIGDCARTMKNNGPAFINATMARSIGWANGASPFFARPIQFEAMKPNSISPACRRFAFSVLADLDSRSFDRNEFRLPLEYDLEGAALAVEGAVVFRGADPGCHIIASRSIPRNASTRAPRRNCDPHRVRDTTISPHCHGLIPAAGLCKSRPTGGLPLRYRMPLSSPCTASLPLRRDGSAMRFWVRQAASLRTRTVVR